jgi:hypothetical protein
VSTWAGRLTILSAVAAGSFVVLAPRLRRWGASEEEARRRLPGDELVASPTFASTRAVTIAAPPAAVWPWLVQMGQGRGGLYSYDWLENVFGLDVHSADRIVPELQQLNVGDRISLGKDAFLVAQALEPLQNLVLLHPEGDWSWVFVLESRNGDRTRLLVRNRWTSARATAAQRAWLKLSETIGFAMERQMLHGIKERAEGTVGATGMSRSR